jgi:hypothetical protein
MGSLAQVKACQSLDTRLRPVTRRHGLFALSQRLRVRKLVYRCVAYLTRAVDVKDPAARWAGLFARPVEEGNESTAVGACSLATEDDVHGDHDMRAVGTQCGGSRAYGAALVRGQSARFPETFGRASPRTVSRCSASVPVASTLPTANVPPTTARSRASASDRVGASGPGEFRSVRSRAHRDGARRPTPCPAGLASRPDTDSGGALPEYRPTKWSPE